MLFAALIPKNTFASATPVLKLYNCLSSPVGWGAGPPGEGQAAAEGAGAEKEGGSG